jgi:hypothetical protein
MKKFITAMMAIMITLTAFSQQYEPEMRTLLGHDKKISHGGYGAITLGYTQLDGKDAFMMGFKGGWIIDHRLTLGFAGTSFVNDISAINSMVYDDVNLAGGYGGLLIEPIISPFSPIHIAFPIIVGAGGVAHVNYSYWNYDTFIEPVVWDSDAFFVVEPGIEIEVNVARFMRAAFGVSYRYTSLINLPDTKKDGLRGLNFGLALKFGKF